MSDDRVIVVQQQGGSLVKVCDTWDDYETWFNEYGQESYGESEIEAHSAKVYRESEDMGL